ncbi:MAG: AMP-binding protein, partial [Methylobacteriaceae bacterium]|nr:AMP-binding protein [Methylobacteriaceae bacterium]
MSEADALARKHPIAAFSLDALVAGAAKLRPARVALGDAGAEIAPRALTYGEFDAQVHAVAQHFIELGIEPGERILILTGARTACVTATIAALAAGIEPLLAPVGIEAVRLGEIAKSSACTAIAGPASYGVLDLEQTLFEAAASSETVRFVATLGPGQADGAIDLSPESLPSSDAKLPHIGDNRPRVGTLNSDGEALFHEQSALLAAALDLVGKAGIAANAHILTTLAPASFAGFVAGPVASLLSGAPLTLFGPFEAASFLAALDTAKGCHCVCPAPILPDLKRAGLLRHGVLASAIAIARDEQRLDLEIDCPLIEVRVLSENSIA